ncbi:hypothetical protein KKF34_11640 [Myxococcota bacterium]|nr:hypothetical protein [Myxococcota bacterium]MBU1381509.1 hypothetical protein [Myxococcota bacterium]MBU1497516.1 hypothetical protein [Myxococcota bacterium]
MMEIRIHSNLLFLILKMFLIPGLILSAGFVASCDDTSDTSIENGCKKDSDCPLPDRQKCNVELGICSGHTTKPGDVDAAPGDDASF